MSDLGRWMAEHAGLVYYGIDDHGVAVYSDAPIAPEQLAFPDITPPPVGTALLSIDQRFAAFHRLNPNVYLELRRRALVLAAQGHRRVSVKMLFEVVRYSAMTTRGDDVYKLNNDFTSLYARMLIDNNPELVDAIETRQLRGTNHE